MKYVGIDPGFSGGIVAITAPGEIHTMLPMPEDEQRLWRELYLLREPSFVLIEKIPPAIFGADKASCAKLYGNYMSCRMALTAAGTSFQEITAKEWQKELGVVPRLKNETKTVWKNSLLNEARILFPAASKLWSQKKAFQLQVADALLIAEVCRRLCNP